MVVEHNATTSKGHDPIPGALQTLSRCFQSTTSGGNQGQKEFMMGPLIVGKRRVVWLAHGRNRNEWLGLGLKVSRHRFQLGVVGDVRLVPKEWKIK